VPDLNEIRWQGDSRRVTHGFPKGARNALGKELTRIQMGLQPRNGKWLTGVGRSVLADCIYVLHAFQKKSKTGIETPKEEIDLAKKRYKELVQSLRRS
jgi:phage-related protein